MALVRTKIATAARTGRSGRQRTSGLSSCLDNALHGMRKVVVSQRVDHMADGLVDALEHDRTFRLYSKTG